MKFINKFTLAVNNNQLTENLISDFNKKISIIYTIINSY